MDPTLDSIALMIVLALGVGIGAAAGLLACGLIAQRRAVRAEKRAWSAARRFYERAYTLTPKG